MGDRGTGRKARQRGAARVAKEVQHADRPAGRADLFLIPRPVDGLLRKDAGVLEAGGADDQGQVVPVDLPLLGQPFVVIPLPAALGGAVVDGISVCPQRAGFGIFPDDLRVRSDQ